MLLVAGDEQLPVREARAGKPEAWDALFKRYQLPLYAYVFELVHNEQTSLDIVQETFINAVRHLGGLQEDGKFGSWMFSIAHQKCIQLWRKQGREREFAEEQAGVPVEYGDAPSDWLIGREQEEEFMRMIARLPAAQRSVLLLHFVHFGARRLSWSHCSTSIPNRSSPGNPNGATPTASRAPSLSAMTCSRATAAR